MATRDRVLPLVLSVGAFALSACAAPGRSSPGGDTFSGGSSSGSSATGSGGGSGSGGDPGPLILGNLGPDGSSQSSRPPRCDDAGHCSCINIASIGLPAHYGAAGGDNTDAFVGWLNAQSSASVDMYTTKPAITSAFLAGYDVIIVQWLTAGNSGPYWTFTPAEIAALKAWVEGGGGLVTLSGYDSNSQEVIPLNLLLSFTDISYNMDDVLGSCQNGLCYCWGNSIPLGGWVSGPVGQNVKQVGVLHGRSINPGSATVDCPNPAGNTVLAAHETIGKGHVVAYTDEWVTYTSQWLGTSSANMGTMFTDPNNPCYEMSAAQAFQVPQFWYNVLKFAASATQCPFTIMDPSIIR